MTISVLEQFLREYVDVAGGLWDEPEPQVYDVLWPDAEAPQRLTVDPEALAEHPEEQGRWPYPDTAAIPLEQAYLLARERVLRSVSTVANNLQRDWEDRQSRQIARVDRYFADMRAELQERIQKAAARGEATEDLRQRGTAIEREAALRIAELRRAPGVRVRVALTNLLHLKIPRLFLEARLI